MHDTTACQNIFEKVEQVLHEYDYDLSKLECLSTDGAANIVQTIKFISRLTRKKMNKKCS